MIWHCRSRAGARHGMCELKNGMAGERHGSGMGAAWARHAVCESAFSLLKKQMHQSDWGVRILKFCDNNSRDFHAKLWGLSECNPAIPCRAMLNLRTQQDLRPASVTKMWWH